MIVHSIFKSINGEVSSQHQGSLCTFVRLAGCNLRCSYCDTKYAQIPEYGVTMSVKKVISKVHGLGCHNVVITGGEPLLQWAEVMDLSELLVDNSLSLIKDKYESGYRISIETNGSVSIPKRFSNNISFVVDWKCISSDMADKMKIENFSNLGKGDFIKFVIQDKRDFDYAVSVMKILLHSYKDMNRDNERDIPVFSFSPIYKSALACQNLIEWMKSNKLLCKEGVIFSLQIHKIIYPDSNIEV